MKKYGHALKQALKLITGNRKAWVLFLIFYNVVALLLYTLVSYGLYAASLKISGVTYLASNTLKTYLLCPFTWVFIIVSLLLCMFLIMFEVSALYRMYDASRRGEKISLSRMLSLGLSIAWKSLRPKNVQLFVYLLVMLPVLGISAASNMSYSIFIPGFIMDAIGKMKILYVLVCAGLIFLFLYACRLQYSVAAFVLDGSTYKEAAAKSKRMVKKRFLYTVVSVFLTYLIMTAVFAAVGALFGAVLTGPLNSTVSHAVYVGALVGLVWVSFLGPSVLLAQVSSLYYEIAEEKGEILPSADSAPRGKEIRGIGKALTAAVFLVCLAVTVIINVQDTSLSTAKLSRPQIAAHRGDSGNAPENTMPAFEQAVEDKVCEWIELDVHQTKDGILVVAHDDSLSKIDGSDRCIHELTYEELLQVDFGSRFSEEYAGTPVATLDEVLDYCRDKIRVQIEIKPTDYDDHIEEAVVEQIRDHDMVDSCVVLSLKDTPLRRIKEIAPEITTMYCMALSAGEVTDIDFAEYISIEEQNVTADLINSMHAQNRKCFVWTINDPASVQYLVDCGADVILTDYPLDIDEALNEADYSGGWARTLRLMLNS